MATIDKLDMSVYNLYAIRTKMIEQINQQFSFDKAYTIPPQTAVLDIFPKLTELDILLGIVPMFTPWAYFYPPKNYRGQRKSPFAFHRLAPALGDQTDEVLDSLIAQVDCQTTEEISEKAAIKGCLKELGKLNSMLGFIRGRVGQFLQG